MVEGKSEDKSKRQTPPEIDVINPAYKGATPKQVALALALHKPQDDDEKDA